MLFESNDKIYMYQNGLYYLADITIKEGRTISVSPSHLYVDKIENAKSITYIELKKKYIND